MPNRFSGDCPRQPQASLTPDLARYNPEAYKKKINRNFGFAYRL